MRASGDTMNKPILWNITALRLQEMRLVIEMREKITGLIECT